MTLLLFKYFFCFLVNVDIKGLSIIKFIVRINSNYGKPNIVEVEETCLDSMPFIFENYCSELVLKIKQKGEKQVIYH